MLETFGFIGLGSQGAPMARRMIDAGLPVALWARRPETLEPFSGSSAILTATIAEFAGLVDYVGICVVDDNGVRAICNQLIPLLRPGSCIVIHSTINPELCKELSALATERELKLLDAPVSGGGPAAEKGTLTVMVGGDAVVLDSVRSVFETFARLIVHLGDVGAGQHAKLINNAMMAANLAIAHHGLEAARALSLDRQSFIDLIQISSGRSFSFDVCTRMPSPTDFSHGAGLLAKDVALLGEVLNGAPSFAPIKDAARSFLDIALKESQ